MTSQISFVAFNGEMLSYVRARMSTRGTCGLAVAWRLHIFRGLLHAHLNIIQVAGVFSCYSVCAPREVKMWFLESIRPKRLVAQARIRHRLIEYDTRVKLRVSINAILLS